MKIKNLFILIVLLGINLFPTHSQTNDYESRKSTMYTPNDDSWRAAAEERIEQHRKADIIINVVDGLGQPIADADIAVRMNRHSFGFGALIGQNRWNNRPNPTDAQKALQLAEDYFNKIVSLPAKDATGEKMLNWLQARGIKLRGHYLMWARIQPGERSGQPNVMPEDVNDLKVIAFNYIKEMVTWAGDRVAQWDAINHIVTDISGHLGFDHLFGPGFFAEVINFAREHAPPGVEMWVNEGSILTGDDGRISKYKSQIEFLIEHGGAPDGIGFMSHFKKESDLNSMEEIFRRLNIFAEVIPNLQLTEFDIDLDDQQMHADYLRDVMTIAFSHPAVSSIIMWQIWGGTPDNKHLWNTDWSVKPAGAAWLDLVFNRWWTNVTGSSNSEGKFGTRGFLGDYEVVVRVGNEVKTMLVQVDSDGLVLDVPFIEVSTNPVQSPSGLSIYPNPFTDFLTFEFISRLSSETIISIYDITGRKLIAVNEHTSQGINRTSLEINNIPSGIYYYQVQSETIDGRRGISSGKIIKK